MATIDKRIGTSGKVTWRARVRIQGQTRVATFKRKKDATTWAGKAEKDFDEAFCVVNGHFSIMRKFGDNVEPPSGELYADTVVDIGKSSSRAAFKLTNAFYTLLEYHQDSGIEP